MNERFEPLSLGVEETKLRWEQKRGHLQAGLRALRAELGEYERAVMEQSAIRNRLEELSNE